MEPAPSALERESLTALRVTIVRRSVASYRPALTNCLLVLTLLSLVVFFFVSDRVVTSYASLVTCGLLLLCLGAALLNALASAYARQHTGEIIFGRHSFSLRLEQGEWTLPNDHILALQLNFSTAWSNPPTLLAWGNSLTIAQKGEQLSFILMDLPPNTRHILASLNIASRSTQAPWWAYPTSTLLADCLTGLMGI